MKIRKEGMLDLGRQMLDVDEELPKSEGAR
jgi:hypothetical protein